MVVQKHDTSAPIKHCAWLGAKIAFFVLSPICAIGWLAATGVVLYKSLELGVSPSEIMATVAYAKVYDCLMALVALVIVGVTFCAVTGGVIGAIVATFRRVASRSESCSVSGP